MPLISTAAVLLNAVAKVGSIRGAAAKHNISPSALNRQILNLEHEYGAQLFERLPRGVRLTAAGEVLVADVRRWLHDHEKSRRHLSELRGTIKGHTSIGLMESLARHTVSRLMTFMREQRSQVSLDVLVGGTDLIIERLLKGKLELAICYAAPNIPEITTLTMIEPLPGIVVGRGHPLTAHKSVRLSDCAEYSFVMPDTSLSLRDKLEKTFERLKFAPVPIVTTNSLEVMKMLIRDHGQIALLGLADVFLDADPAGLIHIPFEDHVHPGSRLSLVAARHTRLSPVSSMVAERLKDMLAELPGI